MRNGTLLSCAIFFGMLSTQVFAQGMPEPIPSPELNAHNHYDRSYDYRATASGSQYRPTYALRPDAARVTGATVQPDPWYYATAAGNKP